MDTEHMELLFEVSEENPKKPGAVRWSVGYRAQVTVTVGGATYTEWAAGDAINPVRGDAHDMAIKTAESQAFKRCAVNLGDQFGLSLYNNGSFAATVGDVVGQEHADDGELEPLIQALQDVGTVEELTELSVIIKRLDLSDKVKDTLRLSFLGAKDRIASHTSV